MAARITQALLREWHHLRGASQRWSEDDGALMAAAVAYYLGLSLFPLLLVLLSAFGMFLRYTESGRDAQDELLAIVETNLSSPLQNHVAQALEHIQEQSTLSGPLGLLGILLASLAGFAQFERAFDRIWGVRRQGTGGVISAIRTILIRRGVAFLLLLSSGLLIIVIFVAGLVLSTVETFTQTFIATPSQIWRWAHIGVTLVLNTLLFTLLYRWLSKVDVRWRDAARGAVLAALLWEVGRLVLSVYLLRSSLGSAYGVIGSFIAILLWCYYTVAVVFFGAEYIQQVRHAREDA
jgi:membrane protein